MRKKKIAVATYYTSAAQFYSSQIESLFSEYVNVERCCFEDLSIEKGIRADLVVIPTYTSFEAVRKYVEGNGEIIVANRTISKSGFRRVMDLPAGTKAMLVNVSAEMSMETISLLYQLGAKHIGLTPVYPGIAGVPDISIAITPGEPECVPEKVRQIIDIGNRVLDISTIMDIAAKLELDYILGRKKIREYVKNIVQKNVGLEEIIINTNRLESQLDILLKILDEGIIGINAKGIIYSYNDSAKKIIGYEKDEVIGNYANEMFPEIPFPHVLKSSESIKEKLVQINGYDVIVTVLPVDYANTVCGAVAIIGKFSDTEKKQHKLRVQLTGKGHRAKYDFSNIIGESEPIQKCRNIAKRMAKSDASILIMGESGTGKELFAQAIHNNSKRKGYQFVAVNCAALPESLLESELFGYEEGAFTGAKKGGKLGLFELAHMGTLFLDEIGEMPLKLQARMLRVLQEREVMRIGGDSLMHVNVRIIAATNRNLKELVARGEFRQDLFFRLNVLPLYIPPLRERVEDIRQLAEALKEEFNAGFRLTEEAMKVFEHHSWEGNVRELRNYVEYLANLEKDVVDERDLPMGIEPHSHTTGMVLKDEMQPCQVNFLRNRASGQMIFVLEMLEGCFRSKRRTGRRSLADLAEKRGTFLTEQEIRKILSDLEREQLVEISKGRGGTRITDLGLRALQYIKKG